MERYCTSVLGAHFISSLSSFHEPHKHKRLRRSMQFLPCLPEFLRSKTALTRLSTPDPGGQLRFVAFARRGFGLDSVPSSCTGWYGKKVCNLCGTSSPWECNRAHRTMPFLRGTGSHSYLRGCDEPTPLASICRQPPGLSFTTNGEGLGNDSDWHRLSLV